MKIIGYRDSCRFLVLDQNLLSKSKKRNKKSIFDEYNNSCLMLESPWGTGKTHYYKHHLKKQFNQQYIYISCFAYTKKELLIELSIHNRLWVRILSLQGILITLIDHSWRSLLPKNKIIILDDIERLHKGEENLLDILGIIDELKKNNKVLLIGSIEEIKSEIFSKYLEKIVDDFIKFDSNESLNNILRESTIDLDPKDADYINEIINNLNEYSSNLRIIKNTIPTIINFFKDLKEKYEPKAKEVYKYYLRDQITYLVKARHLYFTDINLFNELIKFNGIKSYINNNNSPITNNEAELMLAMNMTIDTFSKKNWGEKDIKEHTSKIRSGNFSDYISSISKENILIYLIGAGLKNDLAYIGKMKLEKNINDITNANFFKELKENIYLLILELLDSKAKEKLNNMISKDSIVCEESFDEMVYFDIAKVLFLIDENIYLNLKKQDKCLIDEIRDSKNFKLKIVKLFAEKKGINQACDINKLKKRHFPINCVNS